MKQEELLIWILSYECIKQFKTEVKTFQKNSCVTIYICNWCRYGMYFNCTISTFISFNISLSDALAVNRCYSKIQIEIRIWLIDWLIRVPYSLQEQTPFSWNKNRNRRQLSQATFLTEIAQNYGIFFENEKPLS